MKELTSENLLEDFQKFISEYGIADGLCCLSYGDQGELAVLSTSSNKVNVGFYTNSAIGLLRYLFDIPEEDIINFLFNYSSK